MNFLDEIPAPPDLFRTSLPDIFFLRMMSGRTGSSKFPGGSAARMIAAKAAAPEITGGIFRRIPRRHE